MKHIYEILAMATCGSTSIVQKTVFSGEGAVEGAQGGFTGRP